MRHIRQKFAACVAIITVVSLNAAFSLADGRVYRDHVEPHWFAGHSRFWYRNALRDEAAEFVLVDAENGKREPAFDHARVAGALTRLLGKEVAADHLPIISLDFESEPGAVLLIGRGKTWRLDPHTYDVLPRAGGPIAENSLPAGRNVHPSKRSDVETSITFENQTEGVVEVWWIDPNGQRQRYAMIKPGQEWEQNTFAGHVWLVTDAAGKNLGVFDAGISPGSVIIDGKPLADRADISSRSKSGARLSRKGDRRASPRGPRSPDGEWTAFVKDDNLFVRAKDGGEFQLSHDGKSGDGYIEEPRLVVAGFAESGGDARRGGGGTQDLHRRIFSQGPASTQASHARLPQGRR